nr:hydantoinase/carbamoylase family amidase [Acidobacteriota bacterium]
MSAHDVIANLKELATRTATPDGAQRLAWGPVWRDAREWFNGKLASIGLEPTLDAAGNSWVTLPGQSDRAVIIGGHLDSVPNGGWLDGSLGVLAAFEALRMFTHHRPRLTLKLVDWADEEGARFSRSLLGSSAASGSLKLDDVRHLVDKDGTRLVDALRENGVVLDRMLDAHDQLRAVNAAAYLELHIEQGPALEDANQPVGVVGGIVGITWIEVTITGQSDHAGPSPMRLRRDPLVAASEIFQGVERIAIMEDEIAVATVGRVSVEPNVINTIPGTVVFSVDFRHPDGEVLA